MYAVFIISAVITVVLTVTMVLVTSKAYSRKWDDEDNETKGQV